MASLKKAIKDLFKPEVMKFGIHTRSISQWIQASLREQDITLLEMKDDIILEYKGYKFKVCSRTIHPVISVYDDYRFDRIREGDIVVDIGAQIGAFSIPASTNARRVYAVEPLFYDTLCENAKLNKADNVVCLNSGIGKTNKDKVLNYWGCSKNCSLLRFKTLRKSIEEYDKIDYLKIDCEGSEWCIDPKDFEGIRTIEAELHTFNYLHVLKVRKWERWLKGNGYECELIKQDSTRYMLHAELLWEHV